MAKKNRKGIEYPKKFMKRLKKQKNKKIRQAAISQKIVEKELNNAQIEL